MTANHKAKGSSDELAKKLQDRLRERRPRTVPVVLLVTALALAALGFLIWWLYPRPGPPRLLAVAFDQVGVTGDVVLHGRLDVPPSETRAASLRNLDLTFEDGKALLRPGEERKQVVVKTGPEGAATCPWSFPADFTQGDFIVRWIGTREAPGGEDRGRVAMWPKESRLVVVQIEQTLTPARDLDWEKRNILEIPVSAGTSDVLTALEAKNRLVYLALEADRPNLYQRMRGWIKNRWSAPAERYPPGPVLSRFTLDDKGARPWQQTGASLKKQFAGGHVAITGTMDAAQQLDAAGFTVYFLGQGEDLPGTVRRVQDWAELRRLLPK